jgi:hypothetical protein
MNKSNLSAFSGGKMDLPETCLRSIIPNKCTIQLQRNTLKFPETLILKIKLGKIIHQY